MIKDENYYQSLDKRSKEYREWKASQKKGLGDAIETVTKTTGIKKIVETVFKDCGCDKRKEKANAFGFNIAEKVKGLIPSKLTPRCITEEEYNKWKKFQKSIDGRLRIEKEEVKYIVDYYSSVFNRKTSTPCPTCSPKPLIQMIKRLDVVQEQYENELNKK